MRITDVVTPQELRSIFEREIHDVKSFGNRRDLSQKYIDNLSDRISDEYMKVLAQYIPNPFQSCIALRLLALLDRFLEEKYASSKEVQ